MSYSLTYFGWMNESPKCFLRALIASVDSGESLVVTSNLSPLMVNGSWSPPNVSHIFILSFSNLDIEFRVTHIFNQDIKQIPKEIFFFFNLCGKCAFFITFPQIKCLFMTFPQRKSIHLVWVSAYLCQMQLVFCKIHYINNYFPSLEF